MGSEQYFPARTMGDGMENNSSVVPERHVNIAKKSLHRMLMSMKPVQPSSKIINLVPRYNPQDKKLSNIILSKPKEPKFVPYEPYKAAVHRIKSKPISKPLSVVSQMKPTKNNVEIQQLVTQMTEMRFSEMNKLKTVFKEEELIPRQQWAKEKEAYEVDIKNLKETKSHLENQLKFQAQVNSELKTLLVAAVGEDLESRVQHLTEDKLSLARALLNSANHLTSHQEQTEWLSGQCEVWRSKFLASSLMVEELARWKSALTNRTHDLQEALKKILNEHRHLQKQLFATFKNLTSASKKLANKSCDLKLGDIMDLSNANLVLSEEIGEAIGIEVADKTNIDISAYAASEKLALKVLKNPVTLASQDVLCNALVGAAHSMTGDQNYTSDRLLHPCCSHCRGETQNI